MNRSKIWLTIAEAFYCEPEDRTRKQNDVAGEGLCHSLEEFDYTVKWQFIADMAWEENVKAYPNGGYFFGNDKWNRQHDLIRADFAYLLSILTDKEYEELTK